MKLTLISVRINGILSSAFVNIPYVNGKAIVPDTLVYDLASNPGRGQTISIG